MIRTTSNYLEYVMKVIDIFLHLNREHIPCSLLQRDLNVGVKGAY